MQWKITDTDRQNQTKKLLNMKLRRVGITVIKQQLEFYYFLILYSTKFRDFNLRVSYISRVLNFAIFSKSRKSRNLVLAKLSENKVQIPFIIQVTCAHLIGQVGVHYLHIDAR